MTAILAINHFLHGEKYDTIHRYLAESAKKCGIDLIIKTNLELACCEPKADFVLFWDKDISLAAMLEAKGMPVFNSAHSIALCDDKGLTYASLYGVVPQPDTMIAPKSFFDGSDYSNFLDCAVNNLGLPLVYKDCFGSFGEQVFLCKDIDDIKSHISSKPFLLQRFIASSAGKDIRIEIVDGKCVAASYRENKSDFRSNVTNGGTMINCVPKNSEIKTAVTAADKLGLLFCGVDILNDGSVCEVNSNAHIINLMNSTGIDVAPVIFEAILRRVK